MVGFQIRFGNAHVRSPTAILDETMPHLMFHAVRYSPLENLCPASPKDSTDLRCNYDQYPCDGTQSDYQHRTADIRKLSYNMHVIADTGVVIYMYIANCKIYW